MSMLPPGEPRIHDIIESARGPMKCRIPQKIPTNRNRPSFTNTNRTKGEATKQKHDTANRFPAKNSTRARQDEQTRPKSANARTKEDVNVYSGRLTHNTGRITRTNYLGVPPKRPSALPKLSQINEPHYKKGVIMVPVAQRPPLLKKLYSSKPIDDLPDQETIKKHEDQIETNDSAKAIVETEDSRETIESESEDMVHLKIIWQEKMIQFEQMQQDLNDLQNRILELYAVMQNTHQKMESLGENAVLPSVEELRIMNVTKLTPEQLLRLCSGSAIAKLKGQDALCKISVAIDVQKLHNMPAKLVKACDETLLKRKEIIDWFDSLKSLDKGISMSKLSKKINEFNAENEMMKSCLEQLKIEYSKEIEEIVDFLRKGVNDSMALQLRTEELTYELSSLNSQNTDLRKQLRNSDHLRSQSHKAKFEELQKELKEEKTKRLFLKDRLARTDGQMKMNQERAEQLESALEQARTQNLEMEITIQELREQNRQLQSDFDTQLATLNESLLEHTKNLEEITDAREKLEIEKEDLESHLKEIVENYNESVLNIKHDMNVNVAKLIETEEKCSQLTEDKTKLEQKMELMSTQLLEFEMRYKNASSQILENEGKLVKAFETQRELETTKDELFEARSQILDYKNRLASQTELFTEIERNYKESVELNQSFKNDLIVKEEYITELEKKQSLLEEKLQENETKMESYVEQLTSLKAHISQLQEYFGEFENLNDLHDKVYNQQTQLLELTRHNAELAESLQKKEEQLEQLTASHAEQETCLERREGMLSILTEKEKEQNNIIKILRNNLEARSQAENNLNQQCVDKNLEIETLLMDLDSNKTQISKLEKIILTLQDQSKKINMQRKKDQELIAILQNKMTEYEAFQLETSRLVDSPAETFDNLIKIIEDELSSPIEPHLNPKDQEYDAPKQKNAGDRKSANTEFKDSTYGRSVSGKHSGKNVVDNFTQKICIPINDKQYDGDNLDRKRAITKMDTQKWKNDLNYDMYHPVAGRKSKEPSPTSDRLKTTFLARNIQNVPMDDKRFKLAIHRM